MSRRKDYQPLSDHKLDRLRIDAEKILGTVGQFSLPAKDVYWMVKEIIDSREEIFRLQLCETVDRILVDELDDDEEDLLAFRWPDDFTFGGDDIRTSCSPKPSFPCKETQRLHAGKHPSNPDPALDGRRMPRVD